MWFLFVRLEGAAYLCYGHPRTGTRTYPSTPFVPTLTHRGGGVGGGERERDKIDIMSSEML